MELNILQCTGQSPKTILQTEMSTVLSLRNPNLELFLHFFFPFMALLFLKKQGQLACKILQNVEQSAFICFFTSKLNILARICCSDLCLVVFMVSCSSLFFQYLLHFFNYAEYLLISLHTISLGLKSLLEFLGFIYLFKLVLNHSILLVLLRGNT